MNIERLKETLKRHEGEVLFPYKCSAGKLTIGIGRNIEDRGITKEESMFLLETDIKLVMNDAKTIYGNHFDTLSDLRQEVILNMIFNLGRSRYSKFKKHIKAIKDNEFQKAADEMMNSRWAVQVGKRSKELYEMMVKG